jgi:hypothetical protein
MTIQKNKKAVVVQDEKSEFLMELMERRNYWMAKGKPEYADGYERLIFIHTNPAANADKDGAKKEKP